MAVLTPMRPATPVVANGAAPAPRVCGPGLMKKPRAWKSVWWSTMHSTDPTPMSQCLIQTGRTEKSRTITDGEVMDLEKVRTWPNTDKHR